MASLQTARTKNLNCQVNNDYKSTLVVMRVTSSHKIDVNVFQLKREMSKGRTGTFHGGIHPEQIS